MAYPILYNEPSSLYENLAGSRYSSSMDTTYMGEGGDDVNAADPYEEIGQDPDDFRDFEDF